MNTWIVTPRMHSIHHPVIRTETDSNYSVIFSFCDRLHKTNYLNKSRGDIVVGVQSYEKKEELTIRLLEFALLRFDPGKDIRGINPI